MSHFVSKQLQRNFFVVGLTEILEALRYDGDVFGMLSVQERLEMVQGYPHAADWHDTGSGKIAEQWAWLGAARWCNARHVAWRLGLEEAVQQ
jgi:hypothetical protein